MVHLKCPHCGYSKSIDKSRLPQVPARVTCPKCRQPFSLPTSSGLPAKADGTAETDKKRALEAGSGTGSIMEAGAVAGVEVSVAEVRPPSSLPTAGEDAAPSAHPVSPLQSPVETGSETTEAAPEEVTVECPHCGFQRQVKKEILPERPSRVSCRSCRTLFTVSRQIGLGEPGSAEQISATPAKGGEASDPSAPSGESCPPGRKEGGRLRPLFKARLRILGPLGICLLGCTVLALVLLLPSGEPPPVSVATPPSGERLPAPEPSEKPADEPVAAPIAEGAEEAAAGQAQAGEERPRDLSMAIVAINYAATVRVNGEEVVRLSGEEGFLYEVSAGSDAFVYGTNIIQTDYQPRPDPPAPPQIRLQVYRLGADGAEELLAEWEVAQEGGRRDFYLEVPRPETTGEGE